MQDANHIRLEGRIKMLEAKLESQIEETKIAAGIEQGSSAEGVIKDSLKKYITQKEASLDLYKNLMDAPDDKIKASMKDSDFEHDNPVDHYRGVIFGRSIELLNVLSYLRQIMDHLSESSASKDATDEDLALIEEASNAPKPDDVLYGSASQQAPDEPTKKQLLEMLDMYLHTDWVNADARSNPGSFGEFREKELNSLLKCLDNVPDYQPKQPPGEFTDKQRIEWLGDQSTHILDNGQGDFRFF